MVSKRILGYKLGPLGMTLAAWDIYRRLPKHYRRQIRAERVFSQLVEHALEFVADRRLGFARREFDSLGRRKPSPDCPDD